MSAWSVSLLCRRCHSRWNFNYTIHFPHSDGVTMLEKTHSRFLWKNVCRASVENIMRVNTHFRTFDRKKPLCASSSKNIFAMHAIFFSWQSHIVPSQDGETLWGSVMNTKFIIQVVVTAFFVSQFSVLPQEHLSIRAGHMWNYTNVDLNDEVNLLQMTHSRRMTAPCLLVIDSHSVSQRKSC